MTRKTVTKANELQKKTKQEFIKVKVNEHWTMYQVTNYRFNWFWKFNCAGLKTSGNYNSKELSLKADGINLTVEKEKGNVQYKTKEIKKGFVSNAYKESFLICQRMKYFLQVNDCIK